MSGKIKAAARSQRSFRENKNFRQFAMNAAVRKENKDQHVFAEMLRNAMASGNAKMTSEGLENAEEN